ncbi:GTP-binding protein Era [Streptomyces misionensis JCM 4497]
MCVSVRWRCVTGGSRCGGGSGIRDNERHERSHPVIRAAGGNRPPRRLRLLRGPPQRGQVHPHERSGRAEGGDHLEPAADHPAHRAGHRAPAGRPADPRRHPRAAQAAHAAGRAAERRGAHHVGRGRRDRVLSAGRPEDRARRPVHRQGTGRDQEDAQGRRRHQDRPRGLQGPRRAADRHRPAGQGAGHRVGGDRAGVGGRRPAGGAAGRPAGPDAARGARALPRGRPHGRAGAGDGRRADPGGGAGGRAGRTAALHRGGRRGDAAARGPPGGPAPAGHPRERLHRAPQPEGHHHRAEGEAAQGGRDQVPQADRGAAGHAGLPRPARQGGQGLAAGPEAAAQAGLLTRTPVDLKRP